MTFFFLLSRGGPFFQRVASGFDGSGFFMQMGTGFLCVYLAGGFYCETTIDTLRSIAGDNSEWKRPGRTSRGMRDAAQNEENQDSRIAQQTER